MNNFNLEFDIRRQPDNVTCGPTCLHAVYSYYSDPISLQEVIAETESLADGGTLAVYLACHALKRGYDTTIISYNLKMFDPTWSGLSGNEIQLKLQKQLALKKNMPEFEEVTNAYLEYLESGGRLKFEVMTPALIRRFLKKSVPVLAGLSATYLYNSAREYGTGADFVYDDIRGESNGHFVVLTGYNKDDRSVMVADPLRPNPIAQSRYYSVSIYRLVCAIMLGILTYDDNLLIIKPKKRNS